MTKPAFIKETFSAFGEVSSEPMTKLRKLIAQNLSQSWSQIPHVTHHDEVDISALQGILSDNKSVSLLASIVKAVTNTLKEFPKFNASLDSSGDTLISKHYYNIGLAVDTPLGLVVPVIKSADTLTPEELTPTIASTAERARKGQLSFSDVEGGSFTVTSLGANGGTGFTPIIKHPEVAILGISSIQQKVIAVDSEALIRPVLPLSLSYDHRVIDGAMAAQFMKHLCQALHTPNSTVVQALDQSPAQ